MQQKEIIRLDARVTGVIAHCVFRAKLANGHAFVAFAAGPGKRRFEAIGPGDTIEVELSPFDMAQGRIVAGPGEELGNEG